MFDISSDALVDVAPIHLKLADGSHAYAAPGMPVRIHLYGPGSEAFALVEQRQSARAVKRAQENDNKITLASPEVRAAEAAEDLADLTSHFENFAYQGESQGRDVFRRFYLDKKMTHYHRQVTKALADAGNWRPGGNGTAGSN